MAKAAVAVAATVAAAAEGEGTGAGAGAVEEVVSAVVVWAVDARAAAEAAAGSRAVVG